MALGRMLENMMGKSTGEVLPLIDLGYVMSQSTRDRADRLVASRLVAKRSLEIGGFGRLLVSEAPERLQKVLAAFPQIKEGSTYAGTTHNWIEGDSRDLKYAQ